jgi:hypothetical protein
MYCPECFYENMPHFPARWAYGVFSVNFFGAGCFLFNLRKLRRLSKFSKQEGYLFSIQSDYFRATQNVLPNLKELSDFSLVRPHCSHIKEFHSCWLLCSVCILPDNKYIQGGSDIYGTSLKRRRRVKMSPFLKFIPHQTLPAVWRAVNKRI